MQIVIKLSDETYKDIKEENGIYGTDYGLSTRITGKVVGAIQSGTEFADRCKECGREKVLYKIRAEIEQIVGERNLDDYDFCSGLICARNIIDKYKEESEG